MTAVVGRANPAARYCCDPVIGDAGRGVFVRDGVAVNLSLKEKAVPAADIVTPNQFELDYSVRPRQRHGAGARIAVDAVHALGPRAILVTSLHTAETPDDSVDLLASDARGQIPACARL